jgi:DNA-binding NtrC family response regulator
MLETPHILVADDERPIRLMLETGLALNGFRVTSVRTGDEAIRALSTGTFDLVLSDVYMPNGGGLDVVRAVRRTNAAMPIILMTAQGSVQAAVDAVAAGANDFIGKPFEIAAVVGLLGRYLKARREAGSAQLPDASPDDFADAGLIGRSTPMVAVYKLIALAARSDATVLVTGESGTGKELVARAIHQHSRRKDHAFLSVNCSGLTDTLLEAELFGYVRGAFTGAASDKAGLFEAVHGGTLFLDELASTSPAFQASLLRVLQSGEIRRVGSTQLHKVDVRVIGSSNMALNIMAAAGTFRADLYYRLSVLSVDLPPLRDRPGDVALLTTHFLKKFTEPGHEAFHLSSDAAEALFNYSYPGNVRELENALRRATALASGGIITRDCLPPGIAGPMRSVESLEANVERTIVADRPTIDEVQRRYLLLVLNETGWNRRRSSVVLGLDRRTIQRLIARYKLHIRGEDIPDDAEPDEEPASLERLSNPA